MKNFNLGDYLHSHIRELLKIEALVLSLVLQALLNVEYLKDISASIRHEDLSQTVGELCRDNEREATILLKVK